MDAIALIAAMQAAAASGWQIEVRPDSVPDSMIVIARREKDKDTQVVTNAFIIDAKQDDVDGKKPLHYTLELLMQNISEANTQHFS